MERRTGRVVYAQHVSLWRATREIECDRSNTATNVDDPRVALDVWDNVWGMSLNSPQVEESVEVTEVGSAILIAIVGHRANFKKAGPMPRSCPSNDRFISHLILRVDVVQGSAPSSLDPC